MDRRAADRFKCNRVIEYRLSQTDTFNRGILKNVSVNGAMLWLKTDITAGKTLEIRSDHDFNPVNMHMRVVRTERTPYESLVGYGCKLEIMVSEVA